MAWIGALIALAGAAVQQNNTVQTEKRQDSELALQLRNQGVKQREADSKVGEEVKRLQSSTSDDSRRKALDSYSTALRTNRAKSSAGLTPAIGSDAFREGSAVAAQGVQDYGAETAGLMSRIDAPMEQRRAESFSYGNLGTDLNLISREAQGQRYLDELRLRAIRRNPGQDLLAAGLSAYGGAYAGRGGSSSGATSAAHEGMH